MTAGFGRRQDPVCIPGQVLYRLDLARRSLQMRRLIAQGLDRIEFPILQGHYQRTEGPFVFMVVGSPKIGRVDHGASILGSLCQSSGQGNSAISTSSMVMSVLRSVHLDAHVFVEAPPIVLDRVQSLREPCFLTLEVLHSVDRVSGPYEAPSWDSEVEDGCSVSQYSIPGA